MEVLYQLLNSKKFLVSFVTMLLVILNDVLGLNLDPETVQMIVLSGASYAVGQGFADWGKEKAKVDQK